MRVLEWLFSSWPFRCRFLLSLTSCSTCMVLDDQLNVLPIATSVLAITPLPPKSVVSRPSANRLARYSMNSSRAVLCPWSISNNCSDFSSGSGNFVEVVAARTVTRGATEILELKKKNSGLRKAWNSSKSRNKFMENQIPAIFVFFTLNLC